MTDNPIKQIVLDYLESEHNYFIVDHIYHSDSLIQEEVLSFIKKTQQNKYEQLYLQYSSNTDKKILEVLENRLTSCTSLSVLRTGLEVSGIVLDLIYTEEDSRTGYSYNSYFTSGNDKSLFEIGIWVNGIPYTGILISDKILDGKELDSPDIMTEKLNKRIDELKRSEKELDSKQLIYVMHESGALYSTNLDDNQPLKCANTSSGERIKPDSREFMAEYLYREILNPSYIPSIIKSLSNKTGSVCNFQELQSIKAISNQIKNSIKDSDKLNMLFKVNGESISFGSDYLCYLIQEFKCLSHTDILETGDLKVFDNIIIEMTSEEISYFKAKIKNFGPLEKLVSFPERQMIDSATLNNKIIITDALGIHMLNHPFMIDTKRTYLYIIKGNTKNSVSSLELINRPDENWGFIDVFNIQAKSLYPTSETSTNYSKVVIEI